MKRNLYFYNAEFEDRCFEDRESETISVAGSPAGSGAKAAAYKKRLREGLISSPGWPAVRRSVLCCAGKSAG